MEKYESIKSKILKLRELVLRGEYKEAQNAQRRIDNILSKYNLSLNEVLQEEQKKKERFFSISAFYNKLFFQCVFQILNLSILSYKKRKKGHYYIEMTNIEYAELNSLFEWHKLNYKREYDKMVKSFTSAYIQKHEIWRKTEPTEEELTEIDYGENNEIDYDEMRRIIALENFMSDEKYIKMIGE